MILAEPAASTRIVCSTGAVDGVPPSRPAVPARHRRAHTIGDTIVNGAPASGAGGSVDDTMDRITSTGLARQTLGGVEYEVQRIGFARWFTRTQTRRILTERAQHEGWELWRLRRYRDGSREAWLRRRIIRARLTVFV